MVRLNKGSFILKMSISSDHLIKDSKQIGGLKPIFLLILK